MVHEDYIYTSDFEESDYWKNQRAENRKRLDEFRESRAVETAIEMQKVKERERLQLIEKLDRQHKEWSEKVHDQIENLSYEGVRYPITGIGPAFVVPRKGESHGRYIRRWVSFMRGVSVKDVAGPRRLKPLVRARQHLFYELRVRTDLSSTQIGKLAGNRDHTTVLHGIGEHARREGLPHIKRSDTWNTDYNPALNKRGPDGYFIKSADKA